MFGIIVPILAITITITVTVTIPWVDFPCLH